MNGAIPLVLMIGLNLWVSVGWALKKDYAMALVFLSYAVATGSFLWIFFRSLP